MKLKINKKKLWRFAYIALTIGIIGFVGVLDPNMVNVFDALGELDVAWVLLSFTGILMYWLTDVFIIKHIASYTFGKYSFLKATRIALVGQYYSALTPSSSGGQPMQVLYMKRDGVPVGTGTALVSIKFITYLGALCSFIIFGYIVRGQYIYQNFTQAFWLTMVGFAVSFIGILFVFFVFINKTFVLKVATGIVKVLAKIRIVKNKERMLGEAEKLVEDFRSAQAIISRHKLKVCLTFIINLAQMASMYSVACFLYVACGEVSGNIFDLFIMQAFLFTTVSLFPAPGSAGASEGGFYLFMAGFFPSDLMFVVMMLWRFVTYYSNIIVGAGVVIGDEIRIMRKTKREQGTGETSLPDGEDAKDNE